MWRSRLILLWLLAAIVMTSLAACGGSPTLEEPTDSSFNIITATPRNTATPTVTPTPQLPELESGALQGLELNFWYVWDPTLPDTLEGIVSQFNAGNTFGIQVTMRQFSNPADFATAMQEGIATRQAPHVVLAHPYEYNAWREVGALVNMAPYLESPSYGLTSEELEQIYPVFLARDLDRADRFGFPGLLSARVLLYNLTWAQELGYPSPPASASGFTQQVCAAHIANGDRTGGWMIDTSPGSAAAWLLAFTGDLEAGSRYAFESEGVEAAFTFLSDLQVQGCAWQPSSAYPDQAFVDRLGLAYPVSTREIVYVEEAFAQSENTDQWTAIAYPNDLGESHTSVYGPSYVMLKSSLEEQIATWLFIRAMTSEQNQTLMAETHFFLPLSRQVSTQLQADGRLPGAWLDALDLLEQGVYEPRFTSWRVVRGVVQDAMTEVLDERFVPGTMSLFLKQLQELAADLHQ